MIAAAGIHFGIVGRHVVEQRLQRAGQEECAYGTEGDAGSGRDQASPDDELLDRRGICAERQPNAELVPLASDIVRRHAVDADHRQQAGERTEERAQRRHQPRLAHGCIDHLVHLRLHRLAGARDPTVEGRALRPQETRRQFCYRWSILIIYGG